MIHYFYGLAANPLTLAHEKIIRDILDTDSHSKVYIGITEHDYKTIGIPYQVREQMVRAAFEKEEQEGRVVILKQDQRTYRFLTSLHDWMDYIVVGTDEWNDLAAGKWHYSVELMNTWKFRVVDRSESDVSSSKVRQMLREGAGYEQLKDMISKTTYDILEKELGKKMRQLQ